MTSFTLRSRMIALALAGSMLATAPAMAATKAKAKPVATKTAPDQPPALTRDEAKAHAAEIFDHLDFNKDGVFNEADMKARYEDRLSREFDRLDTNHDGSVTKAEFIAAHEQPRHPGAGHPGPDGAAPKGPEGAPPPPPPGEHPGPDGHRGPDGHGGGHPGEGPGHHGFMSPIVFQLLHDADPQHTGSVTKDAFIAAELKRFDEADANHDGKVTFEELRASHHGHGEHHHRWGGPRHGGPDGEGPRGWGPPPHGPDQGPDGGPDGHDAPPPPPLT